MGEIKEMILKIINDQRVAPFMAGTVSIGILNKILNNSEILSEFQFIVSIISVLVVFISSIVSYSYLSKLEKEKDTEILEMTKRIVEAVYKHFGVAMANKDPVSTEKAMNPIMQTIVNLVKEFQKLAEKTYKKE